MYMILARETADVDLSWFEKIGHVQKGVIASTMRDQSIALKGSASSSIDHLVECQNTVFLHFDPTKDGGAFFPFEPGWIYRYRGEEKTYKGEDFIELKYEVMLSGPLSLLSYFLVPVVDCEFSHESANGYIECSFSDLWKEGYIKRAK